MTMWTGIVLIVFISVLFGYLGKRARYQLGDARITDRLGKQDLIIRELQERVANLEAIVIEEEKRRPFKPTSARAARDCRFPPHLPLPPTVFNTKFTTGSVACPPLPHSSPNWPNPCSVTVISRTGE